MKRNRRFDAFLEQLFEDLGPQGVVDCFSFLYGAFVITLDGVVIGANEQFLSLIEYPQEELYGMSALELITEDERESMARRFAENDTRTYELKLLSRSGDIKVAIVSPKNFQVGNNRYRLAEFIDVSEQKKILNSLQESEERLRSIFELAPVGIARVSPEGDWLEVNRALCEIVGYSEEELLTQRFQDITHPDDLKQDLTYASEVMSGSRKTYAMDKRYVHRDGHTVWVNLRVSLFRRPDGHPKYFIAIVEDISVRKSIEAELIYQASHDPLTGLMNRNHLYEAMERELSRAERYGRSLAVLMLDLDHFKQINDRYGHQVGDSVLQAVSTVLEETTRESDVLGRFGGEEFLLILPEVSAGEGIAMAERILLRIAAISLPSVDPGLSVTASIGVSCYPDDGTTVHTLVTAADNAMYAAKAAGRNCVVAAGGD